MRPIRNVCVIIDALDFCNPNTESMYKNIITFLDNSTWLIDTVILSSTNVPYDEYLNSKNWIYNKKFHNEKIKNLEECGHKPMFRTNPKFLNYKNKDYNQYIAQFPEDIHNIKSARSVFYAGCCFDSCVRNGPFGYQWFVENTKTRIFTKPDLLMNENKQAPNLENNSNWKSCKLSGDNFCQIFKGHFYEYRRYFYKSIKEL